MKNCLLLLMLVFSAFLLQAQPLYPGLTGADTLNVYTALKVTTPPTIDGNPTDAVTLGDINTSVNTNALNEEFRISPNPNSTNILNLNRAADVEIFNLTGQKVLNSINSSSINISSLKEGVYMVKSSEGSIRKMIRR